MSGEPRDGTGHTAGSAAPPLRQVMETCLYVDDLARAAAFYHDVIGLRIVFEDARLVACEVGRGTLLLLFLRRATLEGATTANGGWIPPHDGSGPAHFAFTVEPGQIDAWRAHLGEHGIEVDSELDWDNGARGVYFRDPDGHLVELLTPGAWGLRDE